MDMEIVTTSGVTVTEIPEEVAADLALAYEKLSALPVNRAVAVDFKTAKDARLFARQAKAWASQNGLAFARKGDIKGFPTRVTFRVYVPRNAESVEDADSE
jgi:hypothetical protein